MSRLHLLLGSYYFILSPILEISLNSIKKVPQNWGRSGKKIEVAILQEALTSSGRKTVNLAEHSAKKEGRGSNIICSCCSQCVYSLAIPLSMVLKKDSFFVYLMSCVGVHALV